MPNPDILPSAATGAEAAAYQIFTDAVSAHTIARADPSKTKADHVACALAVKRAWQSFMALATDNVVFNSEENVTVTPRESYAFIVWRRGGGKAPRARHQTLSAARDEAVRLSKDRPGTSYLVLQEVLRVKSLPVPSVAPKPTAEPDGSCPSDQYGASSDWKDAA